MPLAAAVASSAMSDGLTHPKVLTVGGRDVLVTAGTPPQLHTVLESIVVDELGPGGVSSIEFDIEDPLAEWYPAQAAPIEYWDRVTGQCLFSGDVDHWHSRVWGGVSRTWSISGTGIEAWLDRLRLAADYATTEAPSVNSSEHIARMIARQGVPFSAARYLFGGAPGAGNGIGGGLGDGNTNAGLATFPTIAAGTTLRSAILAVIAASTWNNGISGAAPLRDAVTISFDRTLRVWPLYAAVPPNRVQPNDYTTLTISDTVGGLAAAGLADALEPDDAIREVVIVGGAAAATGVYGDGSGIRGRQRFINDPTLLTIDQAIAAAAAVFATAGAAASGSFRLEDYTPAGTVHAGSILNLTDVAAGVSGGLYMISKITKRFLASGRETWTVGYGGLPPSGAELVRQLTRAVAL